MTGYVLVWWLAACTVAVGATMDEPTWVEIDGSVYGARPDDQGPIGGGAGYARMVTQGDFTVRDLEGLIVALAEARAGQVVFVPGVAEIDLTALIYVEQLVLEVPGGVTLAGDRGQNSSRGAILTSDALDTPVMIRATGPSVRVTGLRIRGPNPKRFNLFDWNRHSIAGTGRPGCSYVARNNVERGTSLSHCFDMHGGRDRKDGTDVAGTSIEIHHNTFRAPQTPIVIRGVPEQECVVHHNWFPNHGNPGRAVRASRRTRVQDNAYGSTPATVRE